MSAFLPYIIAIGAAVAGLLGLWFKAKQAGKAEERAKEAKRRLEAVKNKQEIENEVNTLGPADLDKRFDRWRVPNDKR